ALDLGPVVDAQMRAVGQPVHSALGAVLIRHDQNRVPAHDYEAALRVLHHIALLDPHRAVEIRLQRRLIDDLGARHTAQMEGAHGELRARLADRLSGDDADRLAKIDRRAAREIAPIALAADAVAGLASQRRADANLLDT